MLETLHPTSLLPWNTTSKALGDFTQKAFTAQYVVRTFTALKSEHSSRCASCLKESVRISPLSVQMSMSPKCKFYSRTAQKFYFVELLLQITYRLNQFVWLQVRMWLWNLRVSCKTALQSCISSESIHFFWTPNAFTVSVDEPLLIDLLITLIYFYWAGWQESRCCCVFMAITCTL